MDVGNALRLLLITAFLSAAAKSVSAEPPKLDVDLAFRCVPSSDPPFSRMALETLAASIAKPPDEFIFKSMWALREPIFSFSNVEYEKCIAAYGAYDSLPAIELISMYRATFESIGGNEVTGRQFDQRFRIVPEPLRFRSQLGPHPLQNIYVPQFQTILDLSKRKLEARRLVDRTFIAFVNAQRKNPKALPDKFLMQFVQGEFSNRYPAFRGVDEPTRKLLRAALIAMAIDLTLKGKESGNATQDILLFVARPPDPLTAMEMSELIKDARRISSKTALVEKTINNVGIATTELLSAVTKDIDLTIEQTEGRSPKRTAAPTNTRVNAVSGETGSDGTSVPTDFVFSNSDPSIERQDLWERANDAFFKQKSKKTEIIENLNNYITAPDAADEKTSAIRSVFSVEEAKALSSGLNIQVKAQETSSRLRDEASALKALHDILKQQGDVDSNTAKAVDGAIVAVTAAAEITAIIGSGPIGWVAGIKMASVMFGAGGQLSSIFGAGRSSDSGQVKMLELLKQIDKKLDKLISTTGYHFDRIERSLDTILDVAAYTQMSGRRVCESIKQNYSDMNSPQGVSKILGELDKRGNHDVFETCEKFLRMARPIIPDGAVSPAFSYRLNTALSSLSDQKDRDRLVDERNEFLFKTYTAILTVLRTNVKTDETANRADMFLSPSATVETLVEKICSANIACEAPTTPTKVNSNGLGNVQATTFGDYLQNAGSPSRKLWTANQFLDTPVFSPAIIEILDSLLMYTSLSESTDEKFSHLDPGAILTGSGRIRLEDTRGLLIDYLPLAYLTVVNEAMMSGDVLVPLISKILWDADAGQEKNANLITAARRVIRKLPLIRQNVALFRVKQAAAKSGTQPVSSISWALAYKFAYQIPVDSGMETILPGIKDQIKCLSLGATKEPERYAQCSGSDSTLDKPKNWGRFLRISGKCDGVKAIEQIGTHICEIGSCRKSKPKADFLNDETGWDAEQDSLCLMEPLPDPARFESGTLYYTNNLQKIQELMARYLARIAYLNVIANAVHPELKWYGVLRTTDR